MAADTPTKHKAFLEHMAQGLTQIVVCTRRTDVVVPPAHMDRPGLILNFSYRFGLADLDITDTHISATLSFSGVPFYVRIPFAAIWAIGAHGGPFVIFEHEGLEPTAPGPLRCKGHLTLVSFNQEIEERVSEAPLYLVTTTALSPEPSPRAA